MKRYFVGLGSNIDPARNMAAMLTRLAWTFGRVRVSRIMATAPWNMASAATFLNAVASFETDREPVDVKALFVRWEQELGRDRSDPDRKKKDRPADLDILMAPGDSAAPVPDEPYFTPLLAEVGAPVATGGSPLPMTPTAIDLFGASVGETPSTIDGDGGSGHVRVVEDRLDR